jgi:hypothetical protein
MSRSSLFDLISLALSGAEGLSRNRKPAGADPCVRASMNSPAWARRQLAGASPSCSRDNPEALQIVAFFLPLFRIIGYDAGQGKKRASWRADVLRERRQGYSETKSSPSL